MSNNRVINESGQLVNPNQEEPTNYASSAQILNLTERIEDLEDKYSSLKSLMAIIDPVLPVDEDVSMVGDLPKIVDNLADAENVVEAGSTVSEDLIG
jgi:hypothetical protein